MDYMSTKETAERWGVSLRNVQRLLNEGRVPNAKKFGVSWLIPLNTPKPEDPRRQRKADDGKDRQLIFFTHCALPKGSPENGLVNVPGKLKKLAEADFSFRRGDAACAKALWKRLGENNDSKLSVASLATASAIASGDYTLYYEICEWIKKRERETLSDKEKAMLSLPQTLAAASMSAVEMIPEWLKQRDFSLFPPEFTPFLLYLHSLYLRCIGDYKALVATAGTALALCKSEDTFTWLDIYFGVLCASAYNSLGNTDTAQRYLNDAVELAMPYGFIAPFADYYGSIGSLIEKSMSKKYPRYIKPIKDKWDTGFKNWIDFHNRFSKEYIATVLTAREYQVAHLLVDGFTYRQTAERMHLSVGRIKNIVLDIYGKLDINKRSELHKYIM